MRIAKLSAWPFVFLEIIGIILFFIASHSQFFAGAIISLLITSTSFTLAVMQSLKSGEKKTLTLSIVLLAVIPSIYSIVTNPNAVLEWDPKGMENIAQTIAVTGHIPTQSNLIYPYWYVQFPSSFVLLGMISSISGIPTAPLMSFPIVTSVLAILLTWVMVDISKMPRIPASAKCAAICICSLGFLITDQLLFGFTYQNFGGIMLLLIAYLVFRGPIMNVSISRKQILLILLMLVVLISSNADALLDVSVIMASVIVVAVARHRHFTSPTRFVTFFALVTVSLSLTYLLVLNYSLAESLVEGVMFAFYNLLSSQLPTGVTQYRLLTYVPVETLLVVLSAVGIVLLATLWLAHDTLALTKFHSAKMLPISFGMLIFSALFVFMVVFIAPYGFVIAIKVIPIAVTVLLLFFLESAKMRSRSKILSAFASSTRVTIVILLICLPGFFIIGGYSTYFSPVQAENANYTNILASSSVTSFINSSQTLTVLDSPKVPGYIIYDYIAHRVAVTWQVVEIQPSVEFYEVTLLNGRYTPRNELNLVQQDEISSQIIGTPDSVAGVISFHSIVYSNGFVCVVS